MRRVDWGLVGIYLVAAGLRILNLGSSLFWYDEAFTAWLSRLPLAQLVTATAGDTHPPLFYLLEWGIQHILNPVQASSTEQWLLRIPSLILSLLAIPLAVRIARNAGLSDRGQKITLLLMGLMPFQLFFAQEARMYALFQVEILLCIIAVMERRPWLIALSAAAMLWTHNYAVFYLAPLGVLYMFHVGNNTQGVGLRKYLEIVWCSIWPFILAGITFLPWAYAILAQLHMVQTGYWIPTIRLGTVLYSLVELFVGFGLPVQLTALSQIVCSGALAWASWKWIALLRREDRSDGKGAIVFSMAWFPLIIVIFLSLAWKPILLWRGLIGSAPMIYIMLASALDRLPLRRLAYAALITAPILLPGIVGFYVTVPGLKAGSVGSAQPMVRSRMQLGDQVVHLNMNTALKWMYYAPDLPQVMLTGCPPTPGELTPQTLQAMAVPTITPQTIDPARRYFYVIGLSQLSTPCDIALAHTLIAGSQTIYQDDETHIMYGIYLSDPSKPVDNPGFSKYDPTHAAWKVVEDKSDRNSSANCLIGMALVLAWAMAPNLPRLPSRWFKAVYMVGFVALEIYSIVYSIIGYANQS